MTTPVLDPDLRAGWEPGTPASDSALRAFVLNSAAAGAWPVAAMGGRVLERDDVIVADTGRPGGFANVATLLAPLAGHHAETTLGEIERFYGFAAAAPGETDLPRPTGQVWLFTPWAFPDLRPRGWSLAGHPPLMLRPAGGTPPPLPEGLRISRVRDLEELNAAQEALARGFGFGGGPLLDDGAGPRSYQWDERVLADDRFRVWLGWEGDRPVATAIAFVEAGLNGVIAVATVPEARRRGYAAAVTWCATLAESDLPAALLASDEGRPVYEKMGYISLQRFTLWYRDRPG
jgi:hypothetical protein